MEVKPRTNGGITVYLSGRLNRDTCDEVEQRLLAEADALESGVPLVIDLSGVTFLGSMGIRSLILARKTLSEKQCSFQLINPQPQVQDVLQTIHFMTG